jgi:hypothetical protein
MKAMNTIIDFARVHVLSLACWTMLSTTAGFLTWAAATYARETSNRRANRALARYLKQEEQRRIQR